MKLRLKKTEKAKLQAFCKKATSEAYAITGFPLEKRESKNLGITAIGRLFCLRSIFERRIQ
ncbi:hypothetical protein BK124_06500 [Paenibacillus amylolyticus]|nr:hypothetical protein BK124_06500 [Paenibacillus amylolyticus]